MGGFCLAFANKGFTVVWANEKDRFAVETYGHNFQATTMHHKPIEELSVNGDDLAPVDVLTAGFPCQPPARHLCQVPANRRRSSERRHGYPYPGRAHRGARSDSRIHGVSRLPLGAPGERTHALARRQSAAQGLAARESLPHRRFSPAAATLSKRQHRAHPRAGTQFGRVCPARVGGDQAAPCDERAVRKAGPGNRLAGAWRCPHCAAKVDGRIFRL